MTPDNQALVNEIMGVLLTALLSWVLLQAKAWLAQHATAKQIQSAGNLAHTAVNAVEMMAVKQGWTSAEKKAAAVLRVQELGAKFGVNLTTVEWSSLIESAVLNLQDYAEEIKAPVPPAVEAPAPPHG